MMFRPATLFIAARSSRSKHGATFTTFIQRFSLFGIALGVMALIVVISVMNGFEGQLKSRILGAVPHLSVSNPDPQQGLADWQQQVATLPPLRALAKPLPYVRSQGVIQHQGKLQAVMIQGIDQRHGGAGPALTDSLIRGQWESLAAGEYQLIIGQALAMQLGVQVGQKIRLIAAAGGIYTPFGLMPAQRQFTIAGIFALGSQVDEHLVLTNITDAARLLRLPAGHVSGVQWFLNDAFDAPQLAKQLAPHTTLKVSDWRSEYGELFAAVGMEKRMMWLMLGLIIAVAAFNSISAMMMVVGDKRHDIAVLQTMGMNQRRIQRMFLLLGTINGVVGTLLGLILGVLLSLYLNDLMQLLGIHLLPGTEQGLPIIIQPQQVAVIVVSALLLTLLATWYPASRAAHIQPAEALRYD